jgi:phosphate starvation-inducible PhoH-like protein
LSATFKENKAQTVSEQVVFEDNQLVQQIAGEQNKNLKIIEKQLDVRVHLRGNQVAVSGDRPNVEIAVRLLNELAGLLHKGFPLYASDIVYAIRILSDNINRNLKDIFLDQVFISSSKRVITPKSVKQKEYIEAIRHYDVVFGVGPAGTGKTYLAMAMAVATMSADEVRRIILVRPAVEAGEKLGFLPGDLAEKVNPYLRPLYDALHDMMDYERASKLLQRGAIEVAPLAFMRGRTLNDAFVILDEAQNTTTEQMKMFLTRLGLGSKAVITGDITQIDLPENKTSGLVEAIHVLEGIEDISFIYFTNRDVIRHRLVQKIVNAYDRRERAEHRKSESFRTLEKENDGEGQTRAGEASA